MAPGLKMITDENRIEAPLFGENRVVEQFTGPELLRRRLVAQSQQHASPFAISRPWSTRTARLRARGGGGGGGGGAGAGGGAGGGGGGGGRGGGGGGAGRATGA